MSDARREIWTIAIEGEGVSPETYSLKDLVHLLQKLDEAISLEAHAGLIRSTKKFKESRKSLLSLVGINEGSAALAFDVKSSGFAAVERVNEAVRTGDYRRLQPAPRACIADLGRHVIKRKQRLRFGLESDPNAGVISEDTFDPDIVKPKFFSGSTSMYCQLVRLGGVNKFSAMFKFDDGSTKTFPLTKSQAEAFKKAQLLWREVRLEGQATWDSEDWELAAFDLEHFEPGPIRHPLEVLDEMRDQAGDVWSDQEIEDYFAEMSAEDES